jgi:hypothetical protein
VTAALAAPERRRELHDLARRDGTGPALAALYEPLGEGVVVPGPAGHAVVPAETARRVARVWPSGAEIDPAAPPRALPLPALAGTGLVALGGLPAGECPAWAHRDWATALAWLRLGLSARLLDATMAFLGGREVAGAPLLRQQLVMGALADAAIERLRVGTTLRGQPAGELGTEELADLHAALTGADRTLLRLLGAGGFAADGPGRTAYVSELIAGVHVTP